MRIEVESFMNLGIRWPTMDRQESQVLSAGNNGIQQRLESEELLKRYGLNAAPVDAAAVRALG